MNAKDLVKRLVYGKKADSECYVKYLRSMGMRIGDYTTIYAPIKTSIDETRPYMIEIGNNVKITEGVTILTHGYDGSVIKGKYGDVIGSAGRVTIGDNVFIGMHSTILKGVSIGNNVIIGANSLINRDVPSDCVVVGNPQHIVGDIDTYLTRRKEAQLSEALDLYECWKRNAPSGIRGEMAPKELFKGFFWLFEPMGAHGFDEKHFESVMANCGTYDLSVQRYLETDRQFNSYEDFLAYAEQSLLYR